MNHEYVYHRTKSMALETPSYSITIDKQLLVEIVGGVVAALSAAGWIFLALAS